MGFIEYKQPGEITATVGEYVEWVYAASFRNNSIFQTVSVECDIPDYSSLIFLTADKFAATVNVPAPIGSKTRYTLRCREHRGGCWVSGPGIARR